MKTLLLTLLLLQQAIPQEAGPRVRGRVKMMPAQTMTSMEFDLLGGDPATRRTKVDLAQDGSFEVPGLRPGTYEVYLRGRVNGTIPTGQLATSLELDLLGGDPATRRTKTNLAQDGSFEVLGLTPGTYEVYLMGRVVSTFHLADRDITDLVLAAR